MTPQETSRLSDIAAHTLKTWIERQILETAQPPEKRCGDQLTCAVNQAIDWRRDYTAALTAARHFKTLAEYDRAIGTLASREKLANSRTRSNIRRVAQASGSSAFNDAVHALLEPAALMAQLIFLGKIRRVFVYLHGGMKASEDFGHICPKPGSITGSLFAIMQESGVLPEWKALMGKLPGKNRDAYTRHIAGWGTSTPS